MAVDLSKGVLHDYVIDKMLERQFVHVDFQ